MLFIQFLMGKLLCTFTLLYASLSDNQIRSLLEDSDLSGDDEFVPSPSNIQQADDSSDDDLNAEEVPEERRSSHNVIEGVRPQLFWRSNFVQKIYPPNINYSAIESPSPIGTPAEYFCKTFFEEATKYTNMYSVAKTWESLGTTAHELKVFFGINLMIGCIRHPRLPTYWKKSISLSGISDTISRDRFLALRNNVHFVDTIKPPEEAKTNRLWKVQPVIDTVRRRCHSLLSNFNYYSADEQMIPFTGHCKLKQYIKGKPRPVGVKNFIMTSASAIVLDFEIYWGATTPLGDMSLGLDPSAILRLTQSLPQGSFVYFDRYFTTDSLLAKLKEKGIEAAGIIMVNRIKNVNLKEGRMKRGECHSYVRADEAVVFTECQDSQRVVIASICAGIEPKCKVQSANMGGVDIHDQQVECYQMWFRTRKWTLKCLLHFIDLSVVNCWFIYREHCRENQTAKKSIMDLLKFRMSLSEALL
ncbi:piggyBac transposable element-derived protein 2-like [Schistocerca gregaria]|uniref:piggyBac transposable element-derived protein 2-like n=1 Tax=Schistocerca gregaria TaxID=7010 RepID=UPI00211E9F37|nr:piggyBac transposable element-derived protein 2-like [Schistocerca gregaria]